MELFDKIQEARNHLREVGFLPCDVGIVLGTGLGKLVDEIEVEAECSYDAIPHFPVSTVEFHKGRLIQGMLQGRRLIVMQGRMHHYEGIDMQSVSFPVRVMQALGVTTLFLSGAAGSMNLEWSKGELMLLTDHINLHSSNPLIGPNDERLGTRFPDMSDAYDGQLRQAFEEQATALNIQLRKGVYASVPGPMLETAAEYRFLRTIGADAVGMSTVPEVIVARHGGIRVAAVIVLTDECDPDNLTPIDIPEIIAVAGKAEMHLIKLLKAVVSKL